MVRKNVTVLIAGAFLGASALTMAATNAPVTVLGLPLGGKLQMPIRQCSVSELGTDVRSLCWVGTPTVIKGARSGSLQVPGADQRPKWAAYGSYSAWIGKDGTLRSFEVRTSSADQFVEILNSITGRFGQSERESRPGSAIMSAEWTRNDINIRLLCADSIGCNTTFTAGAAHAAHQRDLAARAAKDAARLATP